MNPSLRILSLIAALAFGGCATTPSGVTPLPKLPPWERPAYAPTEVIPTPEAIPALRVAIEARIRYPSIPVNFADNTYTLVNRAWLDKFCDWEWQAAKAAGVAYTPESFDCDDFSLGFYFFATLAASRSGIQSAPCIARLVVQYDATSTHELCGAATDQGLFIIEPQPDAGPFRVTPLEKYPNRILSITFGDASPAAARVTAAKPYAAYLPNPALTPGAFDSMVTAATLEAWTKTPRKVTPAMKEHVYAEYGVKVHPRGAYEVDHLVSRELGGKDSVDNLWPQSYHWVWSATHKDRLENALHRRVLAGTMDLKVAQQRIASDWIALYIETFPNDVVNGVPHVVGTQPNAEPDTP